MTEQRWLIRHADFAVRDLIARAVGISPFVASVLVNRGVRTPEDVRAFLTPSLSHLHDPFLMKDMDKATERLKSAILNKEKVVVFGDYDVDGIASCVVVRDFLQLSGIDAEGYIPDRLTEGYGLNDAAIRSYAERGFDLMVTVDCGVRAKEAVELAASLGLDVIVTDHHETNGIPESACAVVDPMRPDCSYPFPRLAGVGVAYKLVRATCVALTGNERVAPELREFLLNHLPLVALGTVCDVVPLLGENRVFVKFGLERMAATANIGLRNLIQKAGIISRMAKGDRGVSVRDIAFTVGPRINAAGRLGKADVALSLFTTRDPELAITQAAQLDQMNKERQELEAAILVSAIEKIEAAGEIPPAILLASSDWHQGVLGIVASRLTARYGRPSFMGLIEDDLVRGSARSIEGFDIVACLESCKDLLVRFGGHAGAAGFTLRTEDFPRLNEAVCDYAARAYAANPKMLTPVRHIEAEMPFSAICPALIKQLEQLEPFGHEHDRPCFCATNVAMVGEPRFVGQNNQHLIMTLRHENSSFRSIAFNWSGKLNEIPPRFCVLYYPKQETYAGQTSIQLEIIDIKGL